MGKAGKNNKVSSSKNGVLIRNFLLVVVILGILLYFYKHTSLPWTDTSSRDAEYIEIEINKDTVVNGIHLRTGFVDGPGMQVVINNCTSCHSAKLVTQNRLNKEGWTTTIRWMQETQNLWELGENEDMIIEYLTKNYGPVAKGRRAGLKQIEWYPLE